VLIAGNWKLNCNLKEAIQLSSSIFDILNKKKVLSEVALFPPVIYIDSIKKMNKNSNISIGAQDCSKNVSGAHTGEVSATMLLDIGCKYVIVGHSERRNGNHESNQDIFLKAKSVIDNKMIPIICVGESLKDREAGNALQFIESQLKESIPINNNNNEFIIAYEPIWAIGSGKTATPKIVTQVHIMIRKILNDIGFDGENVSILYGGSVNRNNAKELISLDEVDGFLIGGASLDAKHFFDIYNFVEESV